MTDIKHFTFKIMATMTVMTVGVVLPSCGSNDDVVQLPSMPDGNHQHDNRTILTEADPTIFRDDDGTYYLYGTGANSSMGFMVYKSADLQEWSGPVGADNGYCLTKNTSFGSNGFWAPQVVRRNGVYYMFYTADEQIAVATAKSAAGPFTQSEKKMIEAPCKTIDPFVLFDNDGKAYLYHVRLQNGNRIFVAELTDDLMSIKEETARECITATLAWENTENAPWSVTEGPTVLHIDDTYYMLYSANDFRNIDYAVGVAKAKSPLGPWEKADKPIIHRTSIGHYGTGHGDVFQDSKGQWQYVFHTHNSFTQVSPRKTAVVGLTFSNGTFSVKDDTFHFLRKK